jgi:pimeloyl-ACP methyl ester carboxylesterase
VRRYEDRLAGFTLLHSHPFADDEVLKSNRQKSIELIQSGKKNIFVTQLFPKLFPPTFIANHPDVLEMVVKNGKKNSAEGVIAATKSMMNREDRTDILKLTRVPVQFLLGSEDTLLPTEKICDFIHLPTCAVVNILKGIGHMGMLEAPHLVAQALSDFYDFTLSASPSQALKP